MIDPQVFIQLFVQNERRLYGYIVSMLPDLVAAEDVLQETSLVLWQKFEQFETGTDFFAWACQVARFKVLQHLEKQARSRVKFSQAVLEAIEEQVAVEAMAMDARHRALADCMQKLSDRDRDLITRRYADGATVKSVAQALGRSADAVYKALSRVHAALLDCVRVTMRLEARQ